MKVLVFESTPLDHLPEDVGNLFHLKYLNLNGTKVKTSKIHCKVVESIDFVSGTNPNTRGTFCNQQAS